MGTQQILLIVLSVIIVGAAVAVGIQMFNSQAISSNRSACFMDMNNFASMATAWYKTPASLGGRDSTGDAAAQLAAVGLYIDPTYAAGSFSTDNGTYTLTSTVVGTLVITAAGTETGVSPAISVNMATGDITVTDAQ